MNSAGAPRPFGTRPISWSEGHANLARSGAEPTGRLFLAVAAVFSCFVQHAASAPCAPYRLKRNHATSPSLFMRADCRQHTMARLINLAAAARTPGPTKRYLARATLKMLDNGC